MSEFDDMLVAALRERQDQIRDRDGNPLTARWNNQDLPNCAGQADAGKDLGLAGWATNADLVLVILQEDIEGNLPAPKQTLFYPGSNGKKYRIDKITTPPGSSFIALACIDPTKGAQ